MKRTMISAWIGVIALLPMSNLWGAEPPQETKTSPKKRATAVLKSARHFEKGLAAMLKNNYASACPDLAISYSFDPRPGGLFTLAECLKKWNREETALVHYQRYLVLVNGLNGMERERQLPRIRIARAQVLRIERKLQDPYGTGSLDWPTKDVAIPAETMSGVEAPASKHREGRVPGDAKKDADNSTQADGPHQQQNTEISPAWRYWTVGLGTFGGAALAAGTAAGIVAINEAAIVDKECLDYSCSEAGHAAATRAQTLGRWSTAGVAVGLSAVAASVGLAVFGPSSAPEERKPSGLNMALGPCHTAGVCLHGTW